LGGGGGGGGGGADLANRERYTHRIEGTKSDNN
jgi:hypothetical protein